MKIIRNFLDNVDKIMYISGIIFFIMGVIYLLIELVIDFFMISIYTSLF